MLWISKRRLAQPPAADPAVIVVAHGDALFDVGVRRRPTARRLTLRMSHADGRVMLTLPPGASIDAGRAFAMAHGGWIAARYARRPPCVPFVPGAQVPLRGEAHTLVHVPRLRGLTEARREADGQPVIVVSGDPAHLARRVEDFLRQQARFDLEMAVARHAASLGVTVRALTLKDTRGRWGSCSAAGRLNFSWRIILAPPFVLDYLAAHEVAHLREMNHSPRYWAVARRLAPQTDAAEAWLKHHGASLHAYGREHRRGTAP